MGKFEIIKRNNGEFQFNLKAGNGQIILSSEGYMTKSGCMHGIESVRKNAVLDEQFDRIKSRNGRVFFNLKAPNGHIIGTSEMYDSETGRENGIESVKKNAPQAEIIDLTT